MVSKKLGIISFSCEYAQFYRKENEKELDCNPYLNHNYLLKFYIFRNQHFYILRRTPFWETIKSLMPIKLYSISHQFQIITCTSKYFPKIQILFHNFTPTVLLRAIKFGYSANQNKLPWNKIGISSPHHTYQHQIVSLFESNNPLTANTWDKN